jgi:hypothetical protein
MGKKSSPTPPPPPNPTAIAAAQTEASKEAIYASADVNAVNQYGPTGSVVYNKDGNGVPQSQTTTLTPDGQKAFENTQAAAVGLTGQALNSLDYLPQDQFQLNGMFNPQAMQGYQDFNGDPEAYNQRAKDLSQGAFDRRMDLMRPEFERQHGDLEQNLANRGLPTTGEAYGTQMDRFNTNRNEAITGAARDADMFGSQQEMALRQQEMGQHNMDWGNYSQGQAQGYQQDMATWQQDTRDQLLERNQPFQEAQAYMQGSPMAPAPNAPQLPGYNMQAPNMGQLYNMQYQGQMNNYNQQMQNSQANMGGLMGLAGNLGAAAIPLMMTSDVRVKTDIVKIKEYAPGINWYGFKYKGETVDRVGFMAQEVEKVMPEAIVEIEGVLHVDYGKVFSG